MDLYLLWLLIFKR